MRYINGEVLYSAGHKMRILWLGEHVDSIPASAFRYGSYGSPFEVIHFPKSMKYIGAYAFAECEKLETINIEALANLHYIGSSPFSKTNVFIDSYHVPREMKTFYLSSFNYNANAHIFIGKNIKNIDHEGYIAFKGELIYHLESETPPPYKLYNSKLVIIPNYSLDAYLNDTYWKDLNLKEQNPIEQIKLQFKKLNLEKEETKRLSFTCTPHDADDTRVTWSSSNNEVVKVSNAGDVTAIKPGKAFVYAVSVVDSKVKDSCEIVVLQHIQSFTIEPATVLLTKLGDRIKLQTKIQSGDATDKTIRWNSSNQSVCTVTNDGTVIATGNGSTVVLAYTNDGNIPATCVVTVNTEITGIDNVETTPAVQKSSNGITLRTVLGKYIRIYNSQGTIIYKQRADKDVFELPMSKGMYLIQIDNNVIKIAL